MKKIVIAVCAVGLAAAAAQAQGVAKDFNNFGKENRAGHEVRLRKITSIDNEVKKQALNHARAKEAVNARINIFGADYYAYGAVAAQAPAKPAQTFQAANSARVPEAKGKYVSIYQQSLAKAMQMTPQRKAELEARLEQEKKRLETAAKREAERKANQSKMYAEAITNVVKAGK